MTGTQGRVRVALVASSFHPHTGGVEQHVRQVGIELSRAGVDVEVWTVDRGEGLGEQDVDGVRVRYLPTPLPARSAAALGRLLLAAPRAAAAWRRAHREFRPDVLHVQCFGPNGLYAVVLHHLTGTPLVVTSHGETVADDHGAFDRSALLRAGLRHAISLAREVTAPSELVLEDLRSRFGLHGGVVVPNGVHVEVPVGAPPSLPPGPLVLAVGRLERMKGFDLLLDAVAALDDPRVQVAIGGDGSQREALKDQATRLGLSERVHLLGRLSDRDVAGAMRAADVVVVPSRWEAFGIVALEAWRAGTPLVASVHGGMPEFIRDGVDGLVVDPVDPEALASAIRGLLEAPITAADLAAAGSERVRHYSWGSVAGRYATIHAGAGAGATAGVGA